MKAFVIRALSAAGALVFAIAIGLSVPSVGYSAQSAAVVAAPGSAGECLDQRSPSGSPNGLTPMARGRLVAV